MMLPIGSALSYLPRVHDAMMAAVSDCRDGIQISGPKPMQDLRVSTVDQLGVGDSATSELGDAPCVGSVSDSVAQWLGNNH